jgi:hypothetical protein
LWINSDDMLHPDALALHARTVGFDDRTFYAGDCLYMDADGEELRRHRGRVHSLEELLRIGEIWRAGGPIVQPEVLFPRRAFLSVGGLNVQNHYTMDFELWGRLLMAGLKLEYTGIPFGMFRRHPEQKTALTLRQTESLVDTAERLLEESDLEPELRERLRHGLRRYLRSYRRRKVGRAERLRQWGVPGLVVRTIQSLAARLSGNGEKSAPSDS